MTEDYGNNFYCTVDNFSRTILNDILVKNGWTSSGSRSGDFRLENMWSDLELYGDEKTDVFLNGVLTNPTDSFKLLTELLRGNKVYFSAELYNKEDQMILADTHTSKPSVSTRPHGNLE